MYLLLVLININGGKMNKPLISVAMATYNGEKFLRKQLDSIFNQDYPNIELIVCDDCSTDGTVAILKEYENKHSNMKVIVNEENIGYIKNFEKVFSLCNGEYISISDQDDIWRPDKISLLYKEIENHDVIFSKEGSIDEKDKELPIPKHTQQRFEFSKNFEYNLQYFIRIFNTNLIAGCTSLIKTSFIKKIIPFPEYFTYDHWICINAFINHNLKFIDKTTLYHRKHSNNVSIKRITTLNEIISYYRNKKYKNKTNDKINQIDVIKNRLSLPQQYLNELTKILEIETSIFNFKYTLNDFLLIFKQYKYNKICKMGIKNFINTLIIRIVN